ncbi:MAG: hypothetical protein ACM3IJ_00505 [Candidatus Levyibacteriota bacterium]
MTQPERPLGGRGTYTPHRRETANPSRAQADLASLSTATPLEESVDKARAMGKFWAAARRELDVDLYALSDRLGGEMTPAKLGLLEIGGNAGDPNPWAEGGLSERYLEALKREVIESGNSQALERDFMGEFRNNFNLPPEQ